MLENLRELASPYNHTMVQLCANRNRSWYVWGFVRFREINMAQEFIAKFNGSVVLGGDHPLNVRFADRYVARVGVKVFIGGLAIGTNEEHLQELAAPFGTILKTHVVFNEGKSPCGFVVFASPEQAEAMIAALHGKDNADSSTSYVVDMPKTNQFRRRRAQALRRECNNVIPAPRSGGDSSRQRRRQRGDDYQNYQGWYDPNMKAKRRRHLDDDYQPATTLYDHNMNANNKTVMGTPSTTASFSPAQSWMGTPQAMSSYTSIFCFERRKL